MDGIVVGVDGSDESLEALHWAAAEARMRHRPLRVVSAWEFPFDNPLLTKQAESEPGIPLDQEAVAELDAMIDRVWPESEGMDITAHVIRGHPVRVLLGAADGAELLVVGSRGGGGFSGLLLGSVSQECARQAPCPVVIVHGRTNNEAAGITGLLRGQRLRHRA